MYLSLPGESVHKLTRREGPPNLTGREGSLKLTGREGFLKHARRAVT